MGPGWVTILQLYWWPPLPQRGGVAVGGTGNRVEGGGPTTMGVSSELRQQSACTYCRRDLLPAKPKCMFIGTALAKPLLKIGAMLRQAKLFHFIQLACVRIFMLFGDFSPFRPERVEQLIPKF